MNIRKLIHSMTEVDSMNWLLVFLSTMFDRQNDVFHLMAAGNHVCMTGFLVFYGLSQYKLNRAKALIRDGISSVVHASTDRSYEDTLKAYCRGWFQKYCEVQGEHQPDLKLIHFPAKSQKYSIYDAFCLSLDNIVDDVPSFSTFNEVWLNEFRHCIIPKTIRLGKCAVCEKYEFEKKNKENTKAQKLQYHTLHNQHTLAFKAERLALDSYIHEASAKPHLFHYVCTDYMAPLRMPHFSELPKPFFTKTRPKMHVFGLVDWTFPTRAYVTHWDFWRGDANVHISLLFRYETIFYF